MLNARSPGGQGAAGEDDADRAVRESSVQQVAARLSISREAAAHLLGARAWDAESAVHAWQVRPTPDLELPAGPGDHWIDRRFLDPGDDIWERLRSWYGVYSPGSFIIGLIAVTAGRRHITRYWGGLLLLAGAVLLAAVVAGLLGAASRF
jgi:hypothetical protein